jgi:hypothetical protein
MIERFLEDFAVGQTFRSGRLRIDKERIKTFGAEFDPQPFHLDEDGWPHLEVVQVIIANLVVPRRPTPDGNERADVGDESLKPR